MDSKAPILYLEALDRKNSGFILDGTENLPAAHREELTGPESLWIPNEGTTTYIDEQGVKRIKKIRYINGCDEIDPVEQEKRGFKPNHYNDKIRFEKAHAIVVGEGGSFGLHLYLTKVNYNKDLPDRSETVEPIFQSTKLNQVAEEINEEDFFVADAVKKVQELVTKTAKGFKYNEDRINGMCAILNVTAETMQLKVYTLLTIAKTKPKWMLDIVEKFEQTIVTELSHAMELKVIRFEGNTALYVEDSKVIKSLGTGNIKQDEKVERLADYLKTKEASEVLTELRAKIDLAKEKSFNNS